LPRSLGVNLQNFREILKPIGEKFWPGRKVHEAPAFFWRKDAAIYDTLNRLGKDHIDAYVCHEWYTTHRKNGGKLPSRQPIQRLPFDRFILRTEDLVSGEVTWRLIVENTNLLFPDDACSGLVDDTHEEERLVVIAASSRVSSRSLNRARPRRRFLIRLFGR
jgi:hypothetical protein